MVGLIRRMLGGARTIALASAISACASGSGISFDKEYPPFTPERKQQIETVLLDGIEKDSRIVQDKNYGVSANDTSRDASRTALEFGNEPQEFTQSLYEMANEDLKSSGSDTFPMQDIGLKILPPKEVTDFCGEGTGGCNYNDQIYMMDNDNFLSFMSTIFHETGHSYSQGNKEFVSESSEMLMRLKAYQFSKPIGSMMVHTAIREVGDTPLEQREPFGAMYVRGTLFAVANLLNNYCSIEFALNHVGNSRYIISETELKDKLAEMEGPNLADKYFQMWNEVLDNPNFIGSLTSYGHINETEAAELVDYLRILNYAKKYITEDMTDEAKGIIKTLDEPFALSSSYNNPFFKSQSAYRHTKALHDDIVALGSFITSPETYAANQKPIFELAKKIMLINTKYPCETNNPYECPTWVRQKRYEHVDAYYQMMMHADINDSYQMADSVSYLNEFLSKFYPGTNIENGELGPLYNAQIPETNNYFPPMALRAANHYLIYGLKNNAEKFLRAAVAITCMPDGWKNIQECQTSKNEAKVIMQAYGMSH